jgi:hypothetical protein
MQSPLVWLEENPSVRERALSEVDLGGKPLPDALLADPTRLVAITKAIVIEAVRRDAPEGVVEGLIGPLRRMARGAAEIDRYRHITDALGQAQGLRDRSELEPVLDRALSTAPDEPNRRKLEMMLDVLRRSDDPEALRISADEMILKPNGGSGTSTELSPVGCLTCCGTTCAACLPFACFTCCVVGCLVCP